MKYEMTYILTARMTAVVEADSIDLAEEKLYRRDVLDLAQKDIIEESDIDVISVSKRK